jgi:hypothetical protein
MSDLRTRRMRENEDAAIEGMECAQNALKGDVVAMKRENAQTGGGRDMEIAVEDVETRDETIKGRAGVSPSSIGVKLR